MGMQNPTPIEPEVLSKHPIPPNIWDNPELLWVKSNPSTGALDGWQPIQGWSPIQSILFARKLFEAPEHVDLVGLQDPDTRDTLLHWAVRWNFTQETQLLLSKGADPHQKNNAGETPAELASHSKEKSLRLVMEKAVAKLQREKARKALRPTSEDIEL